MKRYDIVLDTDIGTDIDDAYALALALRAQNLNILGISTGTGDSLSRAKIARKMVNIEGKKDIPIFAGKSSRVKLTHGTWAADIDEGGISADTGEMIDFYWKCIDGARDDSLYLVAIGPLTNIAIIREEDPSGFDEKVNLLIMGGSIRSGYIGPIFPTPEYNILSDINAARKIFESSVSLKLIPLDVTANLKIIKPELELFYSNMEKDGLIKSLKEMSDLFHSTLLGKRAPIMFDPATISILIDENIASFTGMQLKVNRFGFTQKIKESKVVNSKKKEVCLEFNKDSFFSLFFQLIAGIEK